MNADLAMQRALDRLKRLGFAGLSEEEKTLAAIWHFESKVANAGFERYFKTVDGELARHAPAAFRAVEARTQAEIAEQANAVFGPGGVPTDPRLREQALRTLSDEARRTFDALERRYFESARDLEDRLARYLERHAPAAR
ncbi:DMP19 family protein [Opitutus terrae]|uniref:DNA mimic protein DMP19 C-terminal domain-containing protein n=1 Tax=Opitutus terrae (strain DSM 11246 / JCM 15787 / PB90-1) TaxID=452637 RepID=B1ZSZ4_OPITP|nr:DMP19 family protein [Opitutus terrae]ACB75783.1 conserved hypothetical protein [Opitutus terrae PB90-1]